MLVRLTGAARGRIVGAMSVATEHEPLDWWEAQTRECPRCGGVGVLLVVEVTDRSTQAALAHRVACLGDCCIDGLAPDRQCRDCGHRF
jgi:hypothetical protein